MIKLTYYQLAIVWFFIGIFGKIYDDAIDMYFIKHGTFFLEFVKIILIGLTIGLLITTPDIYTPLSIFFQFSCGPIVDYEAFLNDNYWCSISIIISIYAAIYIYANFKEYKIIDIIVTIFLFGISGIPMLQSCVTLNGPIINYLNDKIFKVYFFDIYRLICKFDQSEISIAKFISRIISALWAVILIALLNKYLFNHIQKFTNCNKNLLQVTNATLYFVVGYTMLSAISIYYNLYVDNIYKRRKVKAIRKAERKKRKALRNN